jgi:hypothetical protein
MPSRPPVRSPYQNYPLSTGIAQHTGVKYYLLYEWIISPWSQRIRNAIGGNPTSVTWVCRLILGYVTIHLSHLPGPYMFEVGHSMHVLIFKLCFSLFFIMLRSFGMLFALWGAVVSNYGVFTGPAPGDKPMLKVVFSIGLSPGSYAAIFRFFGQNWLVIDVEPYS